MVTTSLLDLSNSNLTKVPHVPTEFTASCLDLADNNITELPENSFYGYNDLIDINLNGNKLRNN